MIPDSLQTIAEISIGLAGFSGLVVALRKGSGPLSDIQKYRLRILFSLSFGAMFLSLLPDTLVNFGGARRTRLGRFVSRNLCVLIPIYLVVDSVLQAHGKNCSGDI